MTNPVHRATVETEPFAWTLRAVVDALEQAGVPHVVIGEVAHAALGRSRPARTVEAFVRPEHVDRGLVALRSAGFRGERSAQGPVSAAERDGVVVEVRSEARGGLTLDEEMLERARMRVYSGVRVPTLAPEDLFVLAALSEGEGRSHWHDAVALLARFDFDWRYLLRRARHGPRRVLSLILYAESVDRAVPREAVDHLVALLYGLSRHPGSGRASIEAPEAVER